MRRTRPGSVGSQHQPQSRQRHRANGRDAVDGQCHVHRPVRPALTVLAGAVQRIDDPYPRLGEAFGAVTTFLRQETVVRPLRAQRADEKRVERLVSRLAERLARKHAAGLNAQSEPPRRVRQPGREFAVVHARGNHAGNIQRMIRSAASRGVMSVAPMWISGSSGGS